MRQLFTFTLNDFLNNYEEFVNQYLKIEDCLQELQTLPQEYACFSQLLLDAKLLFEKAEASYDYTYALMRTEIRETKGKLGNKLTDKQLDNLVDISEDLFPIRVSLQDAKNNYEKVKEFITALNYKKDMLVQISANSRQEKKLYS